MAEAAARNIGDYALIGDCETAALVHRDGTIAWLCWPRFDSGACFAELLGDEKNGAWRMAAVDADATLSRAYQGDSLVLETRIETVGGSARLIDFMPVRGEASDVIRIVVGETGRVTLKSDLRLRFDYGRLRPRWRRDDDGASHAVSGPHGVRLSSDVEVDGLADGDCSATFTVGAGESRFFVLTYYTSHETAPKPVESQVALRETQDFWSGWCGRCVYDGPARDAVVRSLVIMKALTYRPSGAIVAAPTSSLPESRGGDGNWDYRFCWLRDATFTLLAFLRAGYVEEAKAWRDWLIRAVSGDPDKIQPVYGLTGETRLTEWRADWLAGFTGAKPVRFGNDAFRQRQLDVCGEVINALHHAHARGLPVDEDAWRMALKMVEHLEAVWREPDSGIWERRGETKRFTYSQAMVWLALERVLRRAEAIGAEVPLERWTALRDEVHDEICKHGFDPEAGSFVRDFGSRQLDASLLLLPQIGFLDAGDRRVAGTVAAIERRLVQDGFVFRHEPDDKGGERAAFLACSFWYADVLHMLGRQADAQRVFDQVLTVRNDLGLLPEEFDPRTGTLLGNFPQALSHLALVNTAFRLFMPEAEKASGRCLDDADF
ncbi:MAG TPA: glycoside hydrolase family 15 protein [Caulobacteraceae bacterium]|jgi:GH15 family glucan-1,4-alpha-glucosidase|nr:glycoside hydrolase family 15 protein [Caulobacteraceae bacterium]